MNTCRRWVTFAHSQKGTGNEANEVEPDDYGNPDSQSDEVTKLDVSGK